MTFNAPFSRLVRPTFGPGLATAAAGGAYIAKVLSYSPIAYWPLNDAAGASVAACQVNVLQNGTPTDVTFADALGPDGVDYAPSFNGASSYIDVNTATFNSAFSGTEGAVICWIKVAGAGVWTDAALRNAVYLEVNSANGINIFKSNTSNRVSLSYEADNDTEQTNVNGIVSTDWLFFGITWSDSGDNVRMYYNTTEYSYSTVGTWQSGSFSYAMLGSLRGYLRMWSGWLAHAAVFTTPLSQAAMNDLAVAT